MQVRRAARQLALDVLYEAEIRDVSPRTAFELRRTHGWVIPTPSDDQVTAEADQVEPSEAVLAYARYLTEGVEDRRAAIDDLIVRYADRWAIDRMPVVDRNVVRIALFELLWGEDIPVAVAINEAVELAKSFSTDDSGRFVN
ncbi:MAG: transcription antitermination factor NusB, partial [Actinomycetota bacterium]|nr:transcription antitermination factor NusB [Actinomycetota bacterium]